MPLALLGQALQIKDPKSPLAAEYLDKGSHLMEKTGDRWVSTMGLLGMAMSAKRRRDYPEARKRFTAIAPLFHELGDRHRSNMVKSELAHIDRYEGSYDKAEAAYAETLLEWRRLGHRAAIAHQLESFAHIAQARHDDARAARLFGAAEALRERIVIPMTGDEKIEYEEAVASLKAGMDKKDHATAWAEGRALSMDDAIAYALQQEPRPVSASARVRARATVDSD